jgi:hypothetical protein
VKELEICARVLGSEHPSTLTSMNNLAFTWKEQGRSEAAIELMDKCVQLAAQKLGVNYPDTVSSRDTLDDWKVDFLDHS